MNRRGLKINLPHIGIMMLVRVVCRRCSSPPERTCAASILGRGAIAGLKILSLADRVRKNAVALGFDVLPPDG